MATNMARTVERAAEVGIVESTTETIMAEVASDKEEEAEGIGEVLLAAGDGAGANSIVDQDRSSPL